MLVVNVGKQFWATFTTDFDGVGGVVAQTCEENVGANNDSSSPLTSVTVNQDFISSFFSTLDDEMMHKLDNLHGCLMLRCFQIFPIHIEIRNTCVHQQLRIIAVPNLWDDTFSTIRMLPRFLQVENSHNVFVFHLFDHIEFFNSFII
jgi:hypothetical protein|tara:strand:+ start:1120 stop:1560 length:441 start_codon:yes stop_codon:yes gene_type:complete